MKYISPQKIATLALGLVLTFFLISPLPADEGSSPIRETMSMVAGDIQTVNVKNLTRVSVTNPDVADISDAESGKVSLLAKKAGETLMFLWDGTGKRSIKVRVVSEDLSGVKARVAKLLEEANISGVYLEENLYEGKIVLSGSLTREDKARLENILEPYMNNLLILIREEKNEDLIQVDMQIVEISTSMERDLGILWNSSSASASTLGSTTGSTSGLINEQETLPSTNGNGKIGDFFKIGNFGRSSLQATVNAFIQEGKARLISKPRLVVISGKQASFLVGGEIPIETTTTNTTGSTVTQNTTYSQYGVNVTVTPTIREGKIDVLLNVDIRDIDAAHGANGNVAFITRSAQTNLFMDNKQTIVLAGLIKYADNETVTRVPFLSKLPVVGALFTNHNTPVPDTNTEMVIILTPMVLSDKKFADHQVVMPTSAERASANEIDARYDHESLSPVPVSDAAPTPFMPATAPVPMQVAPTQVISAPIQVTPTATVVPASIPAVMPTPTITPATIAPIPASVPPSVASRTPELTPTPVLPPSVDQNMPAADTSSKSSYTPSLNFPTGIDGYAHMVQEKISKALFYPKSKKGSLDIGGTVKLKLHIRKDGTLDSEEIMASSGNDALDKDALQAAHDAAPFDAFTPGIEQEDLIFTIPIVYSKSSSNSRARTQDCC